MQGRQEGCPLDCRRTPCYAGRILGCYCPSFPGGWSSVSAGVLCSAGDGLACSAWSALRPHAGFLQAGHCNTAMAETCCHRDGLRVCLWWSFLRDLRPSHITVNGMCFRSFMTLLRNFRAVYAVRDCKCWKSCLRVWQVGTGGNMKCTPLCPSRTIPLVEWEENYWSFAFLSMR